MTDNDNIISLNQKELLNQQSSQQRLHRYYELLQSENKRVNLVSRETSRKDFSRNSIPTFIKMLEKLTAESLAPVSILQKSFSGSYLDIGSGGGFPAIPLALSHSFESIHLVERTLKKAAALRRISINLELKAEIHSESFEQMNMPVNFDLITLKLVKLTPRLLNKILNCMDSGSLFIYYSRPDFIINISEVSQTTYCFTIDNNDVVKSITTFKKLI